MRRAWTWFGADACRRPAAGLTLPGGAEEEGGPGEGPDDEGLAEEGPAEVGPSVMPRTCACRDLSQAC